MTLWGVSALLWSAAHAQAEDVLPDPTRPPPEASMAAGPARAAGPVLQSVMIAPGNRSAVIDGQLLKEGELYGDAKLVRITGSEVILSGPEGEQTLKLFPGVEKTAREPRSAQSAPTAKSGTKKSNRNTERKEP